MDTSLCPTVVGRSRRGNRSRGAPAPRNWRRAPGSNRPVIPANVSNLLKGGSRRCLLGGGSVERQSGEDGDHHGHRGHEPACADHDSAPPVRSQSLPSLRELQVEGVAAHRPEVRQYRGTTVQQKAGRTRDDILHCHYTTKPSSLSRKIGMNSSDRFFLI
jgi:hypothetical protein